MRKRWKNKRTILAAALILFFAGCFVRAYWIEPAMLTVRRAEARPANWKTVHDGLRIAVLSDLHLQPAWSEARLTRIVDAVNAENPDIIFFLGDFINGLGGSRGNVSESELTAFLKRFQAPLGVYAVLGNHEFWYGYYRIRRAVEAAGIEVVENRSVAVNFNGADFHIAGIGDVLTGEVDIGRAIRSVPPEEPVLFLTHSPTPFDLIKPGRVAAAFAGHTHGGQIRLPWIGSGFLPDSVRPRHEPGLRRYENGNDLFLTSGIGTSPLPFRWNCPPEIGVVTIRAGQPGQNGPENATK